MQALHQLQMCHELGGNDARLQRRFAVQLAGVLAIDDIAGWLTPLIFYDAMRGVVGGVVVGDEIRFEQLQRIGDAALVAQRRMADDMTNEHLAVTQPRATDQALDFAARQFTGCFRELPEIGPQIAQLPIQRVQRLPAPVLGRRLDADAAADDVQHQVIEDADGQIVILVQPARMVAQPIACALHNGIR